MSSTVLTLKAAFKSQLLWRWVIASICGSFLRLAIARTPYMLDIAPLLCLAGGAAAGGCQWLVLRHEFRRSYWWIVATAIGTLMSEYAIAFARVLAFPDMSWLGNGLFPILLGAAILACVQTLFFAGRVRAAWRWILVSLLGALLVFSFSTLFLRLGELLVEGRSALAFSMLLPGTVIGLVAASFAQGFLLLDFLSEQR